MEQRTKEILKEINDSIEELHNDAGDILNDFMESDSRWEGSIWYAIDYFWGCSESPFGWCAYHKINDGAHDRCIFCHQPQERK